MNGTTNLTAPTDIEKRLEEINETLSSISAKEVLFIIILSFLAVFAAINMCLLILERRKKKKMNSVPQAIVIQPNNVKSGSNKFVRNEKTTKMSSVYEKDVLPSKSMKMKVSISPNMSISKKARAGPSKESTEESSQLSRTEPTSQTDKTIKKAPVVVPVATVTHPVLVVPPTVPPTTTEASADVTTAIEPVSPLQPTSSSLSSGTPILPLPTRAENSQSNESSMTSYTVPEAPTSQLSKGGGIIPPSTPTATTLSGPLTNSEPGKSVATAKDVTQPKSPMVQTPILLSPAAPMAPLLTPAPTLVAPPPTLPIILTTPPPNSEKKVVIMFPEGCGSGV